MPAPFLPEPEAPATAAPIVSKSAAMRVLVLWALLILMFLAIWQFLGPSSDVRAPGPVPAPAPDETHSLVIVTVAPFAVLVVLVFVLLLRAYRQNFTFALAQEPGRLAMARHRYADAVELFRAAVPSVAKQPSYRGIAMLNLGEAQLRAAKFDDALASWAEVERAHILFASAIRTRVATLTALAYGLRGDVVTAERWQSDARARIAKNKDERIFAAAQLRLAEAVILCRKGEHADAVATLENNWHELRYGLNADTMHIVEIVRAFAEAEGGVAAASSVAERRAAVEPVNPGELVFLGVEWPEMRAFLAARGFTGE